MVAGKMPEMDEIAIPSRKEIEKLCEGAQAVPRPVLERLVEILDVLLTAGECDAFKERKRGRTVYLWHSGSFTVTTVGDQMCLVVRYFTGEEVIDFALKSGADKKRGRKNGL